MRWPAIPPLRRLLSTRPFPIIRRPRNSGGDAPVAKLDKALVYETRDYRFESCRVRHTLALQLP